MKIKYRGVTVVHPTAPLCNESGVIVVPPTTPLCNESGVRESLGVHPPREFSICSVGVATVLPIALLLKHNLLYEVVVIYLAAYIWSHRIEYPSEHTNSPVCIYIALKWFHLQ